METFQRSVASRPTGADLSKQYLRLSNRLVVTDTGAILAGSSLGSSSGLSLSSSKGFASQWVWKSATWRLLLLLIPAIFIGQSLLSNRSSQYLDAEGAENAISAVDAIGAAGTAPIAAVAAARGSFASRAIRADGGGESTLTGRLTGSGTGGDNNANPEQQKQQDEWQQQQPQRRRQRRERRERQLREEPFGLRLSQVQQQVSGPQPHLQQPQPQQQQQPHQQQQQQQQQPISMIALTASSSADEASTGETSATSAAIRAETAVPAAARLHGESGGNVADHANNKSDAEGEPSANPYSSADRGGDGGNASSAKGQRGESGARSRIKGSQRFYMVTGEGDYCAGESHWTWSFLCAAAEARLLNRTLIIPMARCLDARHTLSNLTEEKPMALYYDMDHWPSIQPIMLDLLFEINIGPLNVTILRERHNMSVREFQATEPTSRLESEDARSATLIVRNARFAFQMCTERGDERRLERNYNLVKRPVYLWRLAEAIRQSMGGDYDVVHVRRGDKLNPRFWPHLDRDTRPDALLKRLPRFIAPGRHVYIASNERTPGFFSPLASLYKIHVLSDHRHLWAPGSRCYKECQALIERQGLRLGEEGPVFDAQMQVGGGHGREVVEGGCVGVGRVGWGRRVR
ncbi:unnamed protein product [Closterium sp. Naga37s-1]|nr:unnamed protein product [Closterium sp. Naga37s-1]